MIYGQGQIAALSSSILSGTQDNGQTQQHSAYFSLSLRMWFSLCALECPALKLRIGHHILGIK